MRVAVIGCGRMGRWFVRRLAGEHELWVCDSIPGKLSSLPAGIRSLKPEEIASFDPEMVINAVGIRQTESLFRRILPLLSTKCLLVDITSVKGGLAEFYSETGRPFVSLHPMFGGGNTARRGENLVIVSESNPAGKAFFRAFARQQNLTVWEYTFREHDEMMAYSLTLPFVLSMAFASGISGREVPGTTFSRHLGIARRLMKEDEQLIGEILFNPHSRRRLEKICNDMEFLKHVIRARDDEEVHRLLSGLKRNILARPKAHPMD